MSENLLPHSDDQENDQFVMLSGPMDSLFNPPAKKGFLPQTGIYDLSSIPQENNLDAPATFSQELMNQDQHDHFVDSFRKLKETHESESHAIEKDKEKHLSMKKKERPPKKIKSSSPLTEVTSPVKMEKVEKKIESLNNSPINRKDFDFRPIIKTLQKTSENLDKSIKNEFVKRGSTLEPVTSIKQEPIQGETHSPNDKKSLRQPQNDPQTKENLNEETPINPNPSSNESENKSLNQRETGPENERLQAEEEGKEVEGERKRKKEKRSKKKKKRTKSKKEGGPPIISVGIPVNPDEFVDATSNNESPDLLIKQKKQKKEEQIDIFADSRGKPEEPKDSEFAMSLNLWAFLKNKAVPLNDKLFLSFVVNMMIFDIILCVIELVYYSRTDCPDGQSRGFVYINFIFSFIGKLVVFNFINLEISSAMPFDNEIPFLYPIVLFGMFPAMQMPQFVYDYKLCSYRSPIFDLETAYGIMTFIGATLLTLIGGVCILTLCFNDLLNLRNRLVSFSRGFILLFLKLFIALVNFLTLLMTFSQVDHMLPAFFIENICFWFLFLVAAYQRCCGRNAKESKEESSSGVLEEKKGLNDKDEIQSKQEPKLKESKKDKEDIP